MILIFQRIKPLLLVIFALAGAIQAVGFLGAIREHITLTTIYWTFCLMTSGITALNLAIPHLVDIEQERLGSKLRDFAMCALETIVVGWFLYDLHQLRKMRKTAIQMQPMAMP